MRHSAALRRTSVQHVGVQTVLPPGYMCCGYPQEASGDRPPAAAMKDCS